MRAFHAQHSACCSNGPVSFKTEGRPNTTKRSRRSKPCDHWSPSWRTSGAQSGLHRARETMTLPQVPPAMALAEEEPQVALPALLMPLWANSPGIWEQLGAVDPVDAIDRGSHVCQTRCCAARWSRSVRSVLVAFVVGWLPPCLKAFGHSRCLRAL